MMTESEYDAARAKIIVPATREEVAAHDQALALLFLRCGWTQAQIGRKEGGWSNDKVWLWRRFAEYTTASSVETSEPLTFSYFRSCYRRARKASKDPSWFQTVAALMANGTPRPKRDSIIGLTIVRLFSDGQWHRLEAITERIKEPVDGALDSSYRPFQHGAELGDCQDDLQQ